MKLLAVNYHYVRNIKKNNGIFPITPKLFEKQVNEIGKYYDFISMNQLDRLSQKSKKNYCILTFDDNLMEQNIAFDFLKKNKIPFISFISSYPYMEKKVLNVHKLHQIFYKFDVSEILKELKKKFSFDLKEKINKEVVEKIYSYGETDYKRIKFFFNFICEEKIKNDMIDYFFREIYPDEQKFIQNFYLSEKIIKDLSKKDMIGSHSHSHAPLGKIKNFKEDIKLSHNFLKQLTKKNIRYFSYPYGRKNAYNKQVCNFLKNLNYKYAFTMNRGFEDNILKNSLLLKRIDTNDAPLGKLKNFSFYP
jgi:peptidoglycan/xylan/chitin deacetylase (PgdA/CDA1 family)